MAGHSKWANIKHRKAKADAKKGKIFSRITKEIITAVRLGGADPKANPRLRLVLQKARAVNLPSDNIERNIKKATSQDQSDYQDVSYEIYGKGGVGIICEGMTDNKNRAASEVRIALNKAGGTPASVGSVLFNFERKGVIQILKKQALEDELFLAATDAGAQDLEVEEECFIVLTLPADLHAVSEHLEHKGFKIEQAELEWLPKVEVECSAEDGEANLALIEALESIDDIDHVWHNLKIKE